ncbi:hypothetical protein ABIE65_005027 [Constrictibacter sp. MBR-5]|jgi:hypothetical protein|uniref:hypothetical protein n=1 Tax=Constrictibacter sp. MBR-5 TaxID=3156467 RepID=UPI0033914D73
MAEREIKWRQACENCKLPVAVRLTINGRAYYRCHGELSDNGAHCGHRVTFGKRATDERLARIAPAKEQKPADPPAAKSDDGGKSDGSTISDRRAGTGGWGLGSW